METPIFVFVAAPPIERRLFGNDGGVATLEQLERQIFEREGFRVKLVPFAPNARFDPYAFPVMASNGWRVSDWKTGRLGAYLAQIRSIVVFRGDGTPVRTDVRLGGLRDSYFAAYERGELETPAPKATRRRGQVGGDNVVEMRRRGA